MSAPFRPQVPYIIAALIILAVYAVGVWLGWWELPSPPPSGSP